MISFIYILFVPFDLYEWIVRRRSRNSTAAVTLTRYGGRIQHLCSRHLVFDWPDQKHTQGAQ